MVRTNEAPHRTIRYRMGCTVITHHDESHKGRLVLRGVYLTPQAAIFAVSRGMARAYVKLK